MQTYEDPAHTENQEAACAVIETPTRQFTIVLPDPISRDLLTDEQVMNFVEAEDVTECCGVTNLWVSNVGEPPGDF
jgi:hypothetical protein